MKLFNATLIFILLSNFGFAQNKLSKSRITGYYTLIYKLTDKEIVAVSGQSKSKIADSYFHTLIDSFYTDKGYKKKLPYGNYIYVSAIKENLSYQIRPENNVNLYFINNLKEFQFYITDVDGNQIKDALVEIGNGKRLKFDPISNLYKASYPKKEQLIKVVYNGNSNFFTYDLDIEEKNPRKYNYVRNQSIKPEKLPYKGYLVFSKPKYKPQDTVKFKAYVVTEKGKDISNKEVNVILEVDGKDKVLALLKPYRAGGYEYSFKLVDSLNLRLDRSYTIRLEEKIKGKRVKVISNSFKYEDYELKALKFLIRTDKNEHDRNSPLSIYMKGVDENDLTVPDGRVEIVAKTQNPSKFFGTNTFVPDELWKKEINLDPVGETKLVIPDSIFPKASLAYYLYFVFKNSNNETKTASKYLKYNFIDPKEISKEIKSAYEADSLKLDYLENAISTKQSGFLVAKNVDDKTLDSIAIQLPTKIKVYSKAEKYSIRLNNGYKENVYLSSFDAEISLAVFHSNDSLKVLVNNPHKIPFWYTIFSNSAVYKKGYVTHLDTVFKHSNNKAAQVRINYYWDGDERVLEQSTFYQNNLLNVKLVAPDVVYPGQNVNMLVKVTGANNKPVAETDLTAYASTSKFTDNYAPSLPYFGKTFTVRKTKNQQFEEKTIANYSSIPLNWTRWAKQLGLDTIEYYKFTNHNSIYKITESTNDTTTQVAPFVVLDGVVLPVSTIYINNVPVYFDQADQINRYSFVVKPGLIDLRLRTATKEITIKDFNVVKGKKTILSIAAVTGNPNATVLSAPTKLSDYESNQLNNSLLRIKNNLSQNKTVLSTDENEILVNKPENFYKEELLLGPIKENILSIENINFKHKFIKEPDYTYTFLPNLIKQKSYKNDFSFQPNFMMKGIINASYKDYALKENEIDSIWNDYLDLRSRTTNLFINNYNYQPEAGRIKFEIDTAFTNRKPYIKNIFIYQATDLQFLQIYPGNVNYYQSLNKGSYKIMFLLQNNSYFIVENVDIKSSGVNYFYFKDLKLKPADDWSKNLDAKIKLVKQANRYGGEQLIPDDVLEAFNGNKFSVKNFDKAMSGKVISLDKNPIPGASVKIYGLNHQVYTDAKGNFSIRIPENGKLIISYIGFETLTINTKVGDVGNITLHENRNALEEVVVTGYGVQSRKALTASATTITSEKMMEGRVAGLSITNSAPIMIRGMSSIDANKKPLIIVDGLPYHGDIKSISPDDITDMILLKDAEATAIYGSTASNGVIIIKTKKGNLKTNAEGILVSAEQSLRKNFNDEGFWQPKLITDANGTAKFNVTFPDDVTSWKARVIAMNGNKQSGYTETSIKSFKSISANFVSPLFAVTGDSINVLGKLMNYTPLTENGIRKFKYNGAELLNSNVSFKNSRIDTIPIFVKGTDSLSFEYTLTQNNGYFDGELRKIPVYNAGVIETKGFFNALFADTTVNYNFDKSLGKVSLRAEASIFPTLLDEMRKLRDYEYLCNEQLASKLKSLLLEKRVFAMLEKPFNYDKEIKFIIKKLQLNRKPEGTWAWWQNGTEEMWISLHATEALLQAQKDGYAVELNKQKLYAYLIDKLADGKRFDQVYMIKLLNLLDGNNYIKDWVIAYEKQIKLTENKPNEIKHSLYQQLELVQIKQMVGIKVNVEPYLKLKKQTMFGAIYWGDMSYRFWDNSIQNTLLMYKILKQHGGYEAELDKIILFFLEQRKDGQWRNTFESSLILETILPQLIKANVKAEPAYIEINNQRIDKFPYDASLENVANLTLKKGGKMALYFTAYQQFLNPKPEKVSKDFTVNTSFIQKGKTVSKLKAGTLTTLKVDVEVSADADYVMIEIPIPAGCSYENKMQNFWGLETHREYFKNKTVIFSNKLKQGKYTFNIDLMPRYSGSYVLNPAKAEMMYFPVFYGREGMKKVGIN